MAHPAVIQSVEAAWICAVNGIPDGEAADLLPSSLLVFPLLLLLSGRKKSQVPSQLDTTLRKTSGSDRQILPSSS